MQDCNYGNSNVQSLTGLVTCSDNKDTVYSLTGLLKYELFITSNISSWQSWQRTRGKEGSAYQRSEGILTRMEFLKEYTLASLRLKKEKWKKIIISDEQKEYLTNFIESDFPDFMVISQNAGGHLQIHIDWPSELKYKGRRVKSSVRGDLGIILRLCRSLFCQERSSAPA